MNGGLTQLCYALAELRAAGCQPRRASRILFNCDEEVGSRTARPLISAIAMNAAVALVLEPPLPGGAVKTARKGVATYRLGIEGRPVHAGIEPDQGAIAVRELAHQIQALRTLNEPGLGINVGVARGGTRPTVVATMAEAHIDVRVTTTDDADRVDAAIGALRPAISGTRLTVMPDLHRPPLTPTPASRDLLATARAIAVAVGVAIRRGATGGTSDANLIVAAGVATLDGLGPEGAGARADHEHASWSRACPQDRLIAGARSRSESTRPRSRRSRRPLPARHPEIGRELP